MSGEGRSSGEGNGNPLQYSYLENPRDRGAWQAIVSLFQMSSVWMSDRNTSGNEVFWLLTTNN